MDDPLDKYQLVLEAENNEKVGIINLLGGRIALVAMTRTGVMNSTFSDPRQYSSDKMVFLTEDQVDDLITALSYYRTTGEVTT